MIQDRLNYISYRMIAKAIMFLEESMVMEIPTVVTYPDFAKSLIDRALENDIRTDKVDISADMVNRCLEFFENSLVLAIPTVVTYPDFVRDLLRHVFLDKAPAPVMAHLVGG